MVNFETAQVQDEFARIKMLGAAVVAAPYQIGEAWKYQRQKSEVPLDTHGHLEPRTSFRPTLIRAMLKLR